MAYSVPEMTYNELAALEAKNEVIRAQQFRDQAIKNYQAAYEHFWNIRDTGRTTEQRQAKLDAIGSVAIDILTDSATYAGSLVENYPGTLPDLYHSSPFTLDFAIEPGRVLIGDMVEVWVNELATEEE